MVAFPAETRSDSATRVRPARRPRTVAMPPTVVLKRSVTFQPVDVFRTVGLPTGESAAPGTVPPPLVVFAVKFAVTVCAVVSFTVQTAFVPEQAPLQPRNDWPADGRAVRLADAPALKCW